MSNSELKTQLKSSVLQEKLVRCSSNVLASPSIKLHIAAWYHCSCGVCKSRSWHSFNICFSNDNQEARWCANKSLNRLNHVIIKVYVSRSFPALYSYSGTPLEELCMSHSLKKSSFISCCRLHSLSVELLTETENIICRLFKVSLPSKKKKKALSSDWPASRSLLSCSNQSLWANVEVLKGHLKYLIIEHNRLEKAASETLLSMVWIRIWSHNMRRYSANIHSNI